MSLTVSSQNAPAVLLATFFVRDALYGLDATAIQEVIRLGPLTPVHHARREVAGILNLRGKIVTVLDLGLILGLPALVAGGESRVFIIEDRGEFIGLLVDRVDEVVEVEAERIEAPPSNVGAAQGRFFKGVYRTAKGVVTLIDARESIAAKTP